MPRNLRRIEAGVVYHVLNRAVGRMRIFSTDHDYLAFQRVMVDALDRHPVRLLGYCLMPTHWHFVFWPETDDNLSKLMQWMTTTHTRRWRSARNLVGLGPVYQGRFKSFPVQTDDHLLTLLRYVERNPLRANLAKRAENWSYSSLSSRQDKESLIHPMLCKWPIDIPRNYLKLVNEPQTDSEMQAIRNSIRRGRPFGDEPWTLRTSRQLGLQSTLVPAHRPRKQ